MYTLGSADGGRMKVAFVYDIVWGLVTVIGKEVLAAKEVSVMEVDGG